MDNIKHYMYVPFVGLGLYGGYRGDRWFKNRIQIFDQFVIPSLINQTNKNFTVWCSFTHNQKGHYLVDKLDAYLTSAGLEHVFTYNGICFYDDKQPKETARQTLVENLHNTIGELLDDIGEVDKVYMTIQPSDDCYYEGAVEEIQNELDSDLEAIGYKHGYIANYQTLEYSEYNCETNPPFYTIKFDREIFTDPVDHVDYTATKHEIPGYPVGTPLPSHEWVKDCLNYKQINERGFVVGTHGENISTYYNHPFKGKYIGQFEGVEPLVLKFSWRKQFFNKLPHCVKRKLRYWATDKKWILRPLFNAIYNYLRQ